MQQNKGFFDILEDMKEIFSLTERQAYKAIDDLIEESRPDGPYVVLLVLSSVIITAGLLLNNVAILIGGMLITPLLTPLLVVALSITTSRAYLLRRTGFILVKSFAFVFITTLIVSFVLGLTENVQQQQILESSPRTAVLYAIVAIASGIAATLAWIRKEVSSALPGVSIAVSLVPPLAAVGMWSSHGFWEEARFFGLVFLINVTMILLGSVVVFMILHMNKALTVIDKKEQELKEEDQEKEEIKNLAEEIKSLEREALFEEVVDPDLRINTKEK